MMAQVVISKVLLYDVGFAHLASSWLIAAVRFIEKQKSEVFPFRFCHHDVLAWVLLGRNGVASRIRE